MKKSFKLGELSVQSFVTNESKFKQDTIKGGETKQACMGTLNTIVMSCYTTTTRNVETCGAYSLTNVCGTTTYHGSTISD